MRGSMDGGLQIDEEFKGLIPALRPEERDELEQSLLRDGCRDALVVWRTGDGDRVLVDGHNRHEICQAHGLRFTTSEIILGDRLDAMVWIRRNQAARRNLTDDQRAMNAEALEQLYTEQAKRDRARKAGQMGGVGRAKSDSLVLASNSKLSDSSPTVRSRARAAAEGGVTQDRVQRARKVRRARPDLAKQVEDGTLSLAAAVREIKRAEIVANLTDVAAVGLARCERLLAEQRVRETPPIRRCPICLGVEIVASPHPHVKGDRNAGRCDISSTPGRAA